MANRCRGIGGAQLLRMGERTDRMIPPNSESENDLLRLRTHLGPLGEGSVPRLFQSDPLLHSRDSRAALDKGVQSLWRLNKRRTEMTVMIRTVNI